jgi:FdhD protein
MVGKTGKLQCKERAHGTETAGYLLHPDLQDDRLIEKVVGRDQDGQEITAGVIVEKPLTLFLNGQEIVTAMTIGDHPDYLVLGYLLNQNMLRRDDRITAVDVDEDLGVAVVRTERQTDYEEKLKRKVQTSGCAQGTIFGDIMDSFDELTLDPGPQLKSSELLALLKQINMTPSLYLEAGAIHGCVLCSTEKPLIYMEDVGRHNAVDKIAGYMFRHDIDGGDKVFYTTGRLTSEMVIKTVQMGIPILASRSGFTAWGVELARKANLTLIGRAKGKRFQVLSAPERLVYDH